MIIELVVPNYLNLLGIATVCLIQKIKEPIRDRNIIQSLSI